MIFFIISLLCTVFGFKKNSDSIRSSELNFFYFSGFLFLSIHFFFLQKNHFETFFLGDFDYVSLSETLQSSLKGYFFRNHYLGNIDKANFLAHHFSPAMLVLAPFLYLSEFRLGFGYGLLFFHLFSFVLFRKILDFFPLNPGEKALWLFFFLLNLYVYRLFTSYHYESLFLFSALGLILSHLKNNNFLFSFFFLFSLLLKEDISLYLALFSLYLLFEKKKYTALLVLSISFFYFFFVPAFFQKRLDPSASVNWLSSWSKWGKTYPEILLHFISQPGIILNSFLNHKKTILELSLGAGFLFWFYIPSLPLFIGIMLIHFLSDRYWYNTFYNYYIYSLLPFYLFFSLKGYLSLRKKTGQTILLLAISLCLYRNSTDSLFPHKLSEPDRTRLDTVRNAFQEIPKYSCLSVQFDLSGFAPRSLSIYPIRERNLKEFILLDFSKKSFSPYLSIKKLKELKNRLVSSGKYRVMWQKNNTYILESFRKGSISCDTYNNH